MASNISIHSVDSDVFFVEQLSNEPRPQRKNSPNILNLTELSGTHATEMPTISSVASPEPNIVFVDDNQMNPKSLTDLDGSSLLYHQVWKISSKALKNWMSPSSVNFVIKSFQDFTL